MHDLSFMCISDRIGKIRPQYADSDPIPIGSEFGAEERMDVALKFGNHGVRRVCFIFDAKNN